MVVLVLCFAMAMIVWLRVGCEVFVVGSTVWCVGVLEHLGCRSCVDVLRVGLFVGVMALWVVLVLCFTMAMIVWLRAGLVLGVVWECVGCAVVMCCVCGAGVWVIVCLCLC